VSFLRFLGVMLLVSIANLFSLGATVFLWAASKVGDQPFEWPK
jgi:hypothetical protein